MIVCGVKFVVGFSISALPCGSPNTRRGFSCESILTTTACNLQMAQMGWRCMHWL